MTLRVSKQSSSSVVRVIIALFFSMVMLFITSSTVQAHSGRTDSSGGHNCNVGACAGTYHYHNGGGSYSPPPPDYITEGSTNGRAHAQRDADSIRSTAQTQGYQTGYSSATAGEARNSFVLPPTDMCNASFTFPAGTNEVYKSWYKRGWDSECSSISTTVYQTSYGEGFEAARVASASTTEPTDTESTTQVASESDNYLWGLALLGGAVVFSMYAAAKAIWGNEKG